MLILTDIAIAGELDYDRACFLHAQGQRFAGWFANGATETTLLDFGTIDRPRCMVDPRLLARAPLIVFLCRGDQVHIALWEGDVDLCIF